jgi:hypothetical protein
MAENNRTEENKAIDERIARNMKRAARRGKRLTFKNTNNVREFSSGDLGDEFQKATVVGPNYRLPMRNWNTMVNAGITRRAPGVRASAPIVPILPNNSTRRNNNWSNEYSTRYAIAKNEVKRGINARRLANSPNAARAQGKRNHIAALEENSLNQLVSQPTVTPTLGMPVRPARPQSASPARSALGAMGRAALAPVISTVAAPLTREQSIAAGPKLSLATARPPVNKAAAAANRRRNLERGEHERRMAAIRRIRGGTKRTRRTRRTSRKNRD